MPKRQHNFAAFCVFISAEHNVLASQTIAPVALFYVCCLTDRIDSSNGFYFDA